jgi:hypothetical protein
VKVGSSTLQPFEEEPCRITTTQTTTTTTTRTGIGKGTGPTTPLNGRSAGLPITELVSVLEVF